MMTTAAMARSLYYHTVSVYSLDEKRCMARIKKKGARTIMRERLTKAGHPYFPYCGMVCLCGELLILI
jgi:hypothetical protein